MMFQRRKIRAVIVSAVAFVGGLYVADSVMNRAIAEGPAAVLGADVKSALEQIGKAYASPTKLAGTVTLDFDAAGRKLNQTRSFTTTINGPLVFRHEIADGSGTIIAHNDTLSIVIPESNGYVTHDLDESKPAGQRLEADLVQIIKQQNPALLASVNPSLLIDEGSTDVRMAQSNEGGSGSTTLEWKSEGVGHTLWIDPSSHQIRKAVYDVSQALLSNGAPEVTKAQIVIDYTQTAPAGSVDESIFVFTPDANARDLSQPMTADDASALEGKPAPDFTLNDMNDQAVTLAQLKGSVVVLDFWATWCGPCRKGLPHLDEMYQANKDKGLKVFAVNLEEDKPTIEGFVKQTKLGLPVLLDTDGAVARKYAVTAIPQTVIIGADGVVRKVIVGLDEDALDKAVEEAMSNQ